MVVDETIPTIAELKGNTILELFKSGYNKIRGVLSRKQDKLIAGDNIVIDAETNEISAIVGGEPVLDNYYTKPETDAKIAEELTYYYKKTEVYEGDQKCRNEFAHSVISGRLAVYFYLFQNVDAIDYAHKCKIDKRNDHKERNEDLENEKNYIKRLVFHERIPAKTEKTTARIP